MNFFEQELRKIFDGSDVLDNPTFIGRACFGDLGTDLRARIEFAIHNTIDHYSTLQVTVMNRKDGQVDRIKLHLSELLGRKSVPDNTYFQDGINPYIWTYRGESEWYVYKPGPDDYRKLREGVKQYLDVFRSVDERKPALSDTIQGAKSQTSIVRRTGRDHDQIPER